MKDGARSLGENQKKVNNFLGSTVDLFSSKPPPKSTATDPARANTGRSSAAYGEFNFFWSPKPRGLPRLGETHETMATEVTENMIPIEVFVKMSTIHKEKI